MVVETVDYQPMEHGNFPPPTTPDEVGARVLMQERIEDGDDIEMQLESDHEEEEEEVKTDDEEDQATKEAKDNTQVQDMEEESSEDEDMPAPPLQMPPPRRINVTTREIVQPAPMPPSLDKVLVKKGYDPKQATKSQIKPNGADEFLISPITGEKIPASKVQEHMRIGLLDPRWVEQRDRQIQDKINQDTVYAPGEYQYEILRNNIIFYINITFFRICNRGKFETTC